MSGIPVYTQSPINAAKASGTTPQTTTPQAEIPSSNSIPATMTSAASSSPYEPAQPGAASVPGPTTAPEAPQPSPLLPTPTSRETTDDPPHPQPGSVPMAASTRHIHPPPKAGERYRPQETAATPTGTPYQMGIPPPTVYGYQAPRSSTSTTATAAASYPITIPAAELGAPRRSLDHPPNYHQNVYASELSSDQRRAHEANTSEVGAQDTSENVGASFLNTAKKWVEQAGEKISDAEAEVWRRINKE